MKILVTGASGYVGSAVVKELSKRGHKVMGLVRSAPKGALVEKAGATPVVGNLFDTGPWSAAIKDADVIISATRPVRHGEKVSVAESHRRSYNHGKMVGNLLTAAQGSRVKCLIMTYGIQGFGDRGDKWVDETAELMPMGYERTVSGAYWHIDKTSRRTRIPITNMFVGWPYGSDGWFGSIARGIMRGSCRIVGAGDNYLSLIHIDDLAAAYAEVAEKTMFGNRFCIADGNPVTQRELLEFIAEQTGSEPPKEAGVEAHAKRTSELAAELWTCSTRVSGEKMKERLLPELKYPDVFGGGLAMLEELGLLASDKDELPEAAGF